MNENRSPKAASAGSANSPRLHAEKLPPALKNGGNTGSKLSDAPIVSHTVTHLSRCKKNYNNDGAVHVGKTTKYSLLIFPIILDII